MTGDEHIAAAFGAAVRAARKGRGWSQTELGQRAVVSRPTVARIEQGQDGHTAVLSKLANALGLELSVRDTGGNLPGEQVSDPRI